MVEEMTNVRMAVIGLGTMGGRSAAAAVAAGMDVTGFDPSPQARRLAADAGVRTFEDARECLDGAGVVLVSVPRPEHVEQLARDVLVHADEQAVVADLSTIDPETARNAARTLAAHGVRYIDAPVLGRPDKCGQWTLVCGGDPDTIRTVTPVLEASVAKAVIRVGDVGAGSVVKIVNNLMFGAINAITAEALTLVARNDVEPEVFIDAVAGSGAATVSNLFKELAPRMAAGDDEPAFALDLLAKDNRLALQLAAGSGSPVPLARVVDQINTAGLEQGLGARDSGALYRTYATLADANGDT